jgi:hypothetical protein
MQCVNTFAWIKSEWECSILPQDHQVLLIGEFCGRRLEEKENCVIFGQMWLMGIKEKKLSLEYWDRDKNIFCSCMVTLNLKWIPFLMGK